MPTPVAPPPATYPAYLALHESGELARRAARAVEELHACAACPRRCEVDRAGDDLARAVCGIGRHAVVSSAFPHLGEEDCLRGRRGSGTIFFSRCNLHCVFCQNHDISQRGEGREVTAGELAALMLELQSLGCHNVNFVTPEHVVPHVLEALPIAAAGGLRLPIVYNTSAYDATESLALLDGIVDIYMPDFKYWSVEHSRRHLKAKDYPDAARAAIREMHRQVGPLELDEHGVARRGVLVRHLVMPGMVDDARAILRWLAEEVSPDTYVNVMGQYRPAHRAMEFAELARPVGADEVEAVRGEALRQGLRLDRRRSARRLWV
jgi:putative pyruvate formate lyase activating enzyme